MNRHLRQNINGVAYLKTYIIFDTNILFRSRYSDFSTFSFPSIYDEIRGKIERYELEDRFEVYVPEISIAEIFQQQFDAFQANLSNIKENYSPCKQLYGIDLIIKEDYDYHFELQARKEQYLNHNKVKVLPICSKSRFSSIVNRALTKNAPFSGEKGNADKGFKDAVIWESILEFALENKGEYYFITHDKGFKKSLVSEFCNVTNQSISFISKDEINKIDQIIETLSSERSVRSRREVINNLLITENYLDLLLDNFKENALNHLEINGLGCNLIESNINKEIIGLNEIGTNLFRFKLKGQFVVNIFAVPILFETDILIEFDEQNEIIKSMELDGVEGSLSTGDKLQIVIEKFKVDMFVFESDFYFDDSNYVDDEEDGVKINKERSIQGLDTKTTNKITVYELNIYQEYEQNYRRILEEIGIIFTEEFMESFITTLNKNATVDWTAFESKISRMTLSIKSLLKKIVAEDILLEKVVDKTVQQAINDYQIFNTKETSAI